MPGSWEHFGPQEILRGSEIISKRMGTRTELGGAIQVAQSNGLEIVPTLSAMSTASAGPILQTVFEALLAELVTRIKEAGSLDGVFLALHGGMLAEHIQDASGAILAAVRTAIGTEIPLVCSLDLHANVTLQMVDSATAIVGYHTFPHIDLYETGYRGMELLTKTLTGQVRPTVALRKIPMILPGENGRTTQGPYAEVMAMVEELQKKPYILDASAFSVQPWLDVFEIGCSVIVVTNNDITLAQAEVNRLAEAFWERRAQFDVQLTPTHEGVLYALNSPSHPVILSDTADSPSSGAPGDSTVVLKEFLEAGADRPCFLNIVDPPAVAQAIGAGVGSSVTFPVGARYAPKFYQPITISGIVKIISDGEFFHKGLGFQGVPFQRGRTVVLQSGWISLVICERPAFQWDPEFYRSLGLEPRDAQAVVVKSPAAFRANYEPFAAEVLILDAPGVCSPNLRSYPFRNVRRPLYPLDDFQDWRAVEY